MPQEHDRQHGAASEEPSEGSPRERAPRESANPDGSAELGMMTFFQDGEALSFEEWQRRQEEGASGPDAGQGEQEAAQDAEQQRRLDEAAAEDRADEEARRARREEDARSGIHY